MKIFLILAMLTLTLSAGAQSPKISRAAWTSDGQYLLATGGQRHLMAFDGTDGKLVKTVQAKGEPEIYVSFSPDSGTMEKNDLHALAVSGNMALTGSTDYSLQWWTVPDLSLLQETSSTYGILGLSLAHEGRTAAYSATSTRYLDSSMEWIKWTADGLVAESFTDLQAPDSSSSFGVPQLCPQGKWAIASVADEVRLWDLELPEKPSVLLKDVSAPGLAMGDRYFYSLEREQIVRRAYHEPGVINHTFARPGAGKLAVDLAENHLVGLFDGGVWIWDLRDDSLGQWTVKAEDMTLCPDGKKIGLWKEDWFEVWDLKSRTLLFKLARM